MSRNSKHIEEIFSRQENPHSEDLLAYVDGKLSPEEARKIEKAMVDDPMLSDTVEGIEEVGTESFSEMLADLDRSLAQRLGESPAGKEIEFKPEVPQQKARRPRFTYYAAAAAIALLVAFAINFQFGGSPSLSDIAGAGYQGRDAITTVRGHGQPEQSHQVAEYERASTLYEKGKFQEAATIYGKLSLPEAKLMAGHAYFRLNNFDQAATFFTEAMTLDEGNRQDAEYNLALCYLKQDRQEEGQRILRDIAGNEFHTFKVQAKSVLEEIGN